MRFRKWNKRKLSIRGVVHGEVPLVGGHACGELEITAVVSSHVEALLAKADDHFLVAMPPAPHDHERAVRRVLDLKIGGSMRRVCGAQPGCGEQEPSNEFAPTHGGGV